MAGIDPLMTRLAEALRRTAQLTLEPNKYGGLLSEYHKAWYSAKEALAAYDERVAAVAVPEPPTDPAILARLEALEAAVGALQAMTPVSASINGPLGITPAPDSPFAPNPEEDGQRAERRRRHLESVGLVAPLPSVGRRVRSLGPAHWSTGVITEIKVGSFKTIDGKDRDGDYWIEGPDCIGKPGIDFEFID